MPTRRTAVAGSTRRSVSSPSRSSRVNASTWPAATAEDGSSSDSGRASTSSPVSADRSRAARAGSSSSAAATTGGTDTVRGAVMTSPSWASSVTRAFDSTRSSWFGSGPGSGIPATIDKLSVDRGNAPLSGVASRSMNVTCVASVRERWRIATLTGYRPARGSASSPLTSPLVDGLNRRGSSAGGSPSSRSVGADHIGQVVLGAVDRRCESRRRAPRPPRTAA